MSDFNLIVKERKEIIDNYLLSLFKNDNKYSNTLYECMEYAVMAGGKRLRPIIVMLIWEMLTGEKEYKKILPIAASVEMVHTYSLIHDDLPCMDNDDLRRGKPTLHKKHNEAVAILAGDALFSYALEIFLIADIKHENLLNGLKYFLQCVGPQGIVAGQFVDTEIEEFGRDEETLHYIHNHKTATLIEACFAIPALLLGSNESDFEKLKELGRKSGLLFQIIDDILDIESNEETLGKSTAKDIEQNKLTYMTFYSPDKAKALALKQYEEAIDIIQTLDFDTNIIEKLITYFKKRAK